jgi:predicted nucleic acid-binding protein
MVIRMKTTIDLPDELLIEAKKRAAELRRPLRALIVDGLRAQLAEKPKARRKQKKIRFVTVRGGLPVYAHRAAVPEHRRARDALQQAANDHAGWGISLPVVAEFWSIVTHPLATGRPSTPAEAASFIRTLMKEGELRIWLPGAGFAEQLLLRAVELSVNRARIFDLQIALIAAAAGAREIWTHDANFVRVPGIKLRDPL